MRFSKRQITRAPRQLGLDGHDHQKSSFNLANARINIQSDGVLTLGGLLILMGVLAPLATGAGVFLLIGR
jgi:hypothetical protein